MSTAPLLARAPCPPGEPLRVGVLVSGNGSNLQALLDDQGGDRRIVVVVSNVAGAGALARATAAHVPTHVIEHQGLARAAFEEAIVQTLQAHDVEVVVLAGFMRVVTATLLRAFPRRVLNVHPALLPAFPGLHGARQALDHGCRVAGCTVHVVDEGVDTGPILLQATVPVLFDDTEASLQKRIQAEEHQLLPRVVRAMAAGRVVVTKDGRVRVRDEDS